MFDLLPETMVLHALGVGAIGTMILAVITRATLGHIGQPLVAIRASALAYLAVAAGALHRTAAPVWGGVQIELTVVGGLLWSTGFVVILWMYGRMQISEREDGRPS